MRPVWPPASWPWAITTSTPFWTWSRACLTLPQSAMTFMPCRCASAVTGPGFPRPATSTGTRSSSVTSAQPRTASLKSSASSPAARTVANRMSTPKGLSVRSRTRWISRRSSGGVNCAAARTPSPPASETAAASADRATCPIPAWQMGYVMPRRSQRGVRSAERVAVVMAVLQWRLRVW